MVTTLRTWLMAATVFATFATAAHALEVGDAAPPVEMDKWVVGEPVNPAKPDGKSIYLVEFWDIASPPSDEATKKLNALYKEFKDKGLKVVGINAEEEAATRDRLKRLPNDYPSAIDEKGTVFKPYMDDDDRDAKPFAFLTDKEGKILWMGIPALLNNEIDRVVKGALDGTYTMAKAKEIAKLRADLDSALQLRDPDGVLAGLEKLAKIDPQNPDWTINLFNIASRTGKEDKAAEALAQWKEGFKDDANAQAQLAITLMSMQEMDKRDPAGALAAARRAVQLDAANPMVTLTAAQVMMDIGRLDDATKVLADWKAPDAEVEGHLGPIVKQHLNYIAKLKAARDGK